MEFEISAWQWFCLLYRWMIPLLQLESFLHPHQQKEWSSLMDQARTQTPSCWTCRMLSVLSCWVCRASRVLLSCIGCSGIQNLLSNVGNCIGCYVLETFLSVCNPSWDPYVVAPTAIKHMAIATSSSLPDMFVKSHSQAWWCILLFPGEIQDVCILFRYWQPHWFSCLSWQQFCSLLHPSQQ